MGKMNSGTLTLTSIPIPKRLNPRIEIEKQIKEIGVGEGETYLAAGQRYCLAGARGKEGRAGGATRRALAEGAP